MKTSFSNWLKARIVENNDDYYGKDIQDQGRDGRNMTFTHPLHKSNDLDSRFAQVNPKMSELKKYVDQSRGDAVTSLRNLAAGSLSSNRTPGSIMGHDGKPLDEPESRGFRPNNWSNTHILQRLGFRDADTFFKWFDTDGGKEIVANMQKQKLAQQNYR